MRTPSPSTPSPPAKKQKLTETSATSTRATPAASSSSSSSTASDGVSAASAVTGITQGGGSNSGGGGGGSSGWRSRGSGTSPTPTPRPNPQPPTISLPMLKSPPPNQPGFGNNAPLLLHAFVHWKSDMPKTDVRADRFSMLKDTFESNMTQVKLVVDQASHAQKQCALKIFGWKSATIAYRDLVQRSLQLLDEESIANNANILAHYFLWQEQGKLHLLTEYCTDGDMRFHLLHDPQQLTEDDVKRCIVQIANGLKCLHQNELLHLDLKPDNIFVDSGVLKIGDFGSCVRWTDWDGQDGDPRYLAPELLTAQAGQVNSGAPDIFSLGVIACELILKDFPKQHVDNEAFFSKLRQGQVDLSTSKTYVPISSELQKLIQSMLHSDPNLRPSAESILGHPLLCNIRHSLARASTRKRSARRALIFSD